MKVVIFGYGDLIGDIFDIVHANGRRVSRLIINIDEQKAPRRITLRERIERLHYNVETQTLDAFVPQDNECYLIGFPGSKKRQLVRDLSDRFKIKVAALIHPSAIVSPTAKIGDGVLINAGAIIGSHTIISDHAFVNRGATVGHDTFVGQYVTIHPGANIAGHIQIGSGSTICMGANIIEDRIIGHDAVIAAGSVVTSDVADRSLVAGVPARHKKYIE